MIRTRYQFEYNDGDIIFQVFCEGNQLTSGYITAVENLVSGIEPNEYQQDDKMYSCNDIYRMFHDKGYDYKYVIL